MVTSCTCRQDNQQLCEDDGGMPDGLALRFTWVVWQQRAASKTVPYEQATKQTFGCTCFVAQPTGSMWRGVAVEACNHGFGGGTFVSCFVPGWCATQVFDGGNCYQQLAVPWQ